MKNKPKITFVLPYVFEKIFYLVLSKNDVDLPNMTVPLVTFDAVGETNCVSLSDLKLRKKEKSI